MNRIFLGLFMLSLLSACAGQGTKRDSADAMRAVEVWLNFLDLGEDELLWKGTSGITQDRYGKEAQLKLWRGKRDGLGANLKRDLQYNWTVERAQWSLPDGKHRRIMFWSKFENRELARELIIVTSENDAWKIVDWQIGSVN